MKNSLCSILELDVEIERNSRCTLALVNDIARQDLTLEFDNAMGNFIREDNQLNYLFGNKKQNMSLTR